MTSDSYDTLLADYRGSREGEAFANTRLNYESLFEDEGRRHRVLHERNVLQLVQQGPCHEHFNLYRKLNFKKKENPKAILIFKLSRIQVSIRKCNLIINAHWFYLD